jgi:antitoxin PrlF
MKAVAKITSKGQITIPLEIRKMLGVDTGDYLEFNTKGLNVEIKPQPQANPFRQFRGTERTGKGKSLTTLQAESSAERGWDEE